MVCRLLPRRFLKIPNTLWLTVPADLVTTTGTFAITGTGVSPGTADFASRRAITG
ncbi:hypothetical protein D3C85_1045230 [compost metagenome]